MNKSEQPTPPGKANMTSLAKLWLASSSLLGSSCQGHGAASRKQLLYFKSNSNTLMFRKSKEREHSKTMNIETQTRQLDDKVVLYGLWLFLVLEIKHLSICLLIDIVTPIWGLQLKYWIFVEPLLFERQDESTCMLSPTQNTWCPGVENICRTSINTTLATQHKAGAWGSTAPPHPAV